MKTFVSSAAVTLGMFTLAATGVQADNHGEMSYAPTELMTCSYKEGMGPSDLMKVTEAFNKWLKKTEADYTYYILSPMYHEDPGQFDYAWVGSWSSGAGWGADYHNWMTDEDNDVAPMFAEVSDCNQSMAITTPIHVPEGAPYERGVVWFQRCSTEDGMTMADAIAGHRASAEMYAEMGEESASWAFMPGLGMGDVEFDYWHVQGWPNFNEIGEGFDNFFNKGAWKQANENEEGISCSSPNLYVFRMAGSGS